MSYKYRRQSIYLQRKSLSRTSSTDPYDEWTGDGRHSSSTLAASASTTASSPIPPPNLELMKVIKGYEFVTFTPVEVRPPSSNDDEDAILSFGDEPPSAKSYPGRSMSIASGPLPCDSMVKSFDLERMPDNVVINEISEIEAREALFGYVSNKFCHGSKAALQMTIRDMIHSYIFQYSLESFCETRKLCWTFEPYGGGGLYSDSPTSLEANLNGTISMCNQSSLPDNAWSIDVEEVKALEQGSLPDHSTRSPLEEIRTIEVIEEEPSITSDIDLGLGTSSTCNLTQPEMEHTDQRCKDLFQNKEINVVVPGTMSVHSCHNCGGVGRKRCFTCVGSGSKTCQTCHGNGYYGGYYHKSALTKTFESSDYCWRCHGRGRLRCYACNGESMTTCGACLGSGQIKCYIKMIVNLTNHSNNVMVRDHNSADVPLDLLQLAEGDIIFEEEGHNLSRISNFVDDSISRESCRLIELHRHNFLRNSRLILQRHRVKAIPIAKVIAYWQRKQFHFYVFGSQRRCFTNNYPQRYSCPCCCII